MTEPKLPIQLISPLFLEGLATVLQYGANKYASNNWLRGMSYTTVFGGVMRHLWAWFRGETYDPETKLNHLYHAACGLMFLAHYAETEGYGMFDDRVFKIPEPVKEEDLV